MLVEILVLGREERRLDAVGNRLDRQIEPALARELAHQRAVGGMDAGRDRRLVLRQHLVVGQVLGEIADEDADARRDQQRQRRADAEEIADQSNHARSNARSGVRCAITSARRPRRSRHIPNSPSLGPPMWAKCGRRTRRAGNREIITATVVRCATSRCATAPWRRPCQPPAPPVEVANSAIALEMLVAALPRHSAFFSCSSSLAFDR